MTFSVTNINSRVYFYGSRRGGVIFCEKYSKRVFSFRKTQWTNKMTFKVAIVTKQIHRIYTSCLIHLSVNLCIFTWYVESSRTGLFSEGIFSHERESASIFQTASVQKKSHRAVGISNLFDVGAVRNKGFGIFQPNLKNNGRFNLKKETHISLTLSLLLVMHSANKKVIFF